MISSKIISWRDFPPRQFMRPVLKRILPHLIPHSVILVRPVRRQLGIGPQDRVAGLRNSALHRRDRLIPQLVGIRRVFVLFHTLTPELVCEVQRLLCICTKTL